MEETGIDPAFVSVAGYLPRYQTGTGFDISPVVGVLAEGFTLTPDPDEVAEIFEVPLAFLLDPANRRRETPRYGADASAASTPSRRKAALHLGRDRGDPGGFRGPADARML